METVKIFIDGEEITVTGEYIPEEKETLHSPHSPEYFDVYGVSENYNQIMVENNYQSEIIEALKYDDQQNQLAYGGF